MSLSVTRSAIFKKKIWDKQNCACFQVNNKVKNLKMPLINTAIKRCLNVAG